MKEEVRENQYIRENMYARFLSTESIPSLCFFNELNYVSVSGYYLVLTMHMKNISKDTEMLSKNLDLYSPYCGNNIIIRDIATG